MKVAFYGRVSTDDAQDPSLSIPRQLHKCNEALALIGECVGPTYWEVDSGRKELAERGRGSFDWSSSVPVPRLGGLHELLAAAERGEFEAVIVEEIERVSRLTFDGTRIERQLEMLDIPLLAADEPLDRNATAVLTRRVKQGVAEWYVRSLLEKSRQGMEESVRQGWHTGGPAPYGYALEPHPHPNPHKAREGLVKHKLVVDAVRGPIVKLVFTWYVKDGLGLGVICERLNSDLERHPPPRRNRKDENDLVQTWSRSQIHSMLRNPKYTGYNVWNRHDKRRGRPLLRPRDQWVWSAGPTHEAIVEREIFDAVPGRAERRGLMKATTSTSRNYPHRKNRRAGRLYPLRGRVVCGLCGRRMEGSHQREEHWYRCQYARGRGNAAADASGHPRTLGIKEVIVLEAVRDFMAERLFGPDRLTLLRERLLDAATDGAWEERDAKLGHLRAAGKALEQALYRQGLRLEEHEDPGHPVVQLATRRIEELSGKSAAIAAEIDALEATRPETPRRDEIESALEEVPDLREDLEAASPEQLTEVLAAFDMTVVYDKAARTLEIGASLGGELMSEAEKIRPPGGRSGKSSIAGAGFEPATFGLRALSRSSSELRRTHSRAVFAESSSSEIVLNPWGMLSQPLPHILSAPASLLTADQDSAPSATNHS
jgi:site-specific DNA recombinase